MSENNGERFLAMTRPIFLPMLLPALLVLGGCDAPASADQGKNHTIQPGESLFSIAERVYGNGLEWPRIWEANPWVDPDRLPSGAVLYIPPRESAWGNPAPSTEYYASPPNAGAPYTRVYQDPGPGGGSSPVNSGVLVIHNLKRTVTERTLFGVPLERALLVLLLCFFIHSLLQTVLVWIAANLTFVKEVSFRKSLKAVFMTGMLTFTTLVVVLTVGILLVYLGTDPSGSAEAGGPLFPVLEGYLRSPSGALLAAVGILALYVTLSLRFLPQVFNLPAGHAITLMAVAILIPHLLGFYLVGQRAGLLQ
jgi:hypothetical protein